MYACRSIFWWSFRFQLLLALGLAYYPTCICTWEESNQVLVSFPPFSLLFVYFPRLRPFYLRFSCYHICPGYSSCLIIYLYYCLNFDSASFLCSFA
ncbi:hypothetical protein BDV39DRAFT_184591 [Aspergillus sergii]|uniref:Uncharacterized protein n=1 Tax=Aspergillus sergii TaxID=1034303 RepID=A0A5N6WMR4_9EURO|nr:hypothetical protein BDV39DRAFT_184591 [Aspergillus sergii]